MEHVSFGSFLSARSINIKAGTHFKHKKHYFQPESKNTWFVLSVKNVLAGVDKSGKILKVPGKARHPQGAVH